MVRLYIFERRIDRRALERKAFVCVWRRGGRGMSEELSRVPKFVGAFILHLFLLCTLRMNFVWIIARRKQK